MQDPQIQLGELGVTLPDPVEPSRSAVIDAAHRSFVNWEIFFFADGETKARFDADPARYCGVLTDPVSRQRFRPGTRSPVSRYDGRTYLFLTDDHKAAFDADPSAYATVNFDMIPM